MMPDSAIKPNITDRLHIQPMGEVSFNFDAKDDSIQVANALLQVDGDKSPGHRLQVSYRDKPSSCFNADVLY